MLKVVLMRGKTHRDIESVAWVKGDDGLKKFYLDFEYWPLFETDNTISGVMITVNNVTEKVEARQKVEDAEERLRLATEASSLATWDLDLRTQNLIHSSRKSGRTYPQTGTKEPGTAENECRTSILCLCLQPRPAGAFT